MCLMPFCSPMFRNRPHFRYLETTLRISCFTMFAVLVGGCSPPATGFSPNRLLSFRVENELRMEIEPVVSQVQNALRDTFGTPDAPRWPSYLSEDSKLGRLVNVEFLERAAGPFGRGHDEIETGLFRKHCSQCHGIDGDGRGPAAAMLSPYPRDFRRGTFKFKSTATGTRPSIEDLVRTIEHGITGTSMPAMANLKLSRHYADDIEVLAHYVVYLAVRGEVERSLMLDEVRDIDLAAGETFYDPSLQQSNAAGWEEQQAIVREAVLKVARKWLPQTAKPVEPTDAYFDVRESHSWSSDQVKRFVESANRGRETFRGMTAACSQCHGDDGDGNGKLRDFDEWTKDWTVRVGIDPKDSKQWRPLKKLGLLKPVPAVPRNLQWGVFRNGADPDSIFRTITHGIEGTPMPAAALLPDVKNGLTIEQIWELVNYCQALGRPELREKLATLEVKSDGR